jgi:hypothetical protein
MYKIVTLFLLFTASIFAATSQQVDQYMSITHSDRSLIEIEQMFSNLSDTMDLSDENISNQITVEYQIYLGKHISEDEMEELLALYRKPIMQQYINEMDMVDIPRDEMENFLLTLKEEPLSSERQDIIDELLKSIINEELLLNFYNSMMQRYSTKKDSNQTKESNSSKKTLTKEEQRFLDIMKKGVKEELLYGTQVLSLEEMKKINKLMKSTVITKAKRVENEAIINIMNHFIDRIISEPKKVEKQ